MSTKIYKNVKGLEKFEIICIYEGTKQDNVNLVRDIETVIAKSIYEKREKVRTNE